MTTEAAGSSSLANFRKQKKPFPLPPRLLPDPDPATEEISQLLRNSVGWNTTLDQRNAQLRYLYISLGEEYPDLNVEDELKKLKGLLSALGNKYDIYKKQCEEVDLKYNVVVPQLVEELIKKVPHIKVMTGYEHLTSTSEKFQIESALQKRVPEVKLQDEDALAEHLKSFRSQRMPMDIIRGEVYGRLGKIDSLRRDVNNFIQILTAAKQSRLDKSAASDVKRKKPESPAKTRENLGFRKEVEDGLLKVQREVGGPRLNRSAIQDGEFNKKWDNIVDDLTNLLTEASDVVYKKISVVGGGKRRKPESTTKDRKKLGEVEDGVLETQKEVAGPTVKSFDDVFMMKLVNIGKVEDGLLEILKEVAGPTVKRFVVDNDKFMMKLVNIGDALTRFLDYYFC